LTPGAEDDAPNWTFWDSPLQGLYFRPSVYQKATSFDDFQPWLDRVVQFPERVAAEALEQLPPKRLEGDEAALETLLSKLMVRRHRVPDLILDSRRARFNPFPNWK